jgi:hypothetical protein
MTIARRYPVARERAFNADIESTARKTPVIGEDGTSKSVGFPTDSAAGSPLSKASFEHNPELSSGPRRGFKSRRDVR